LPYHAISQSGVLAVARAFRRPVVATEVVRAERLDPREGRVVACGDAEAFADALAAVLDDPPVLPRADASLWERNAAALRWVCESVVAAPAEPAEGGIGAGPANPGETGQATSW